LQTKTGRKFPQQVPCEFVLRSGKDEPMSAQDSVSAAASSPFIFGVSGHRDVLGSDALELQKRIRTVFDRFRLAYPQASFELLSPLAEGADRLAAEAALHCGIRFAVPLPMAQAEYERDFTIPESLEEFRRLLAAAASVFEVSSKPSDDRASKYAAVGDYIARRSNVLILLWDGQDNSKLGGTAWVKKRREHWIESSKEKESGMDPFGYAGTIQIVTPRRAAAVSPKIEIIGDLPSPART
jgi:hypothetical protein